MLVIVRAVVRLAAIRRGLEFGTKRSSPLVPGEISSNSMGTKRACVASAPVEKRRRGEPGRVCKRIENRVAQHPRSL